MIMCCRCGKRWSTLQLRDWRKIREIRNIYELILINLRVIQEYLRLNSSWDSNVSSKSPFCLWLQSGSVVISRAVYCGDNGVHSRLNRKPVGRGSGCKSVKMSPSLFNFVDAKDKFTVRSSGFTFASFFKHRSLFCIVSYHALKSTCRQNACCHWFVLVPVMFVLPQLVANASSRLS